MNTLFELGEQVRNRYTVREIHWQRVYFTRTHVTLLFHNFTFIIYKSDDPSPLELRKYSCCTVKIFVRKKKSFRIFDVFL